MRKYVDPKTGKVDEYDTFAYTDGGFNIRPYPFRKYLLLLSIVLYVLSCICCFLCSIGFMASTDGSVIEVRDQERLKIIEREYHNAEEFLNVYEPYR